jgi:hypothetical protein
MRELIAHRPKLLITNAREMEVDDLDVHFSPPFKDEARVRRLGT